MNLFDLI
jgi:hypothetical protein